MEENPFIEIPQLYWLLLIGGTLLFTCLIPLVILLIMKYNGNIKDLDVSDPKERTIPYIFTIFSLSLWSTFLQMMQVPSFLYYSSTAITIALIIVTIITHWWKISVHLASFGGSIAMLAGILWYFGIPARNILIVMFVLAWLLMLARIRLNAHTPLQTVCGFLLGLTIVFIPNIFDLQSILNK